MERLYPTYGYTVLGYASLHPTYSYATVMLCWVSRGDVPVTELVEVWNVSTQPTVILFTQPMLGVC